MTVLDIHITAPSPSGIMQLQYHRQSGLVQNLLIIPSMTSPDDFHRIFGDFLLTSAPEIFSTSQKRML